MFFSWLYPPFPHLYLIKFVCYLFPTLAGKYILIIHTSFSKKLESFSWSIAILWHIKITFG